MDNCFTVLCWFLQNISMNEPYMYPCPLPSPSLSHSSRLLLSLSLNSLGHTANSHQLSSLHWSCMLLCYSIHIPSPLPPYSSHVYKSVLHVSVSIAILQLDSSVPSFQIPYVCVNIWYLLFSFWLASLSITGSRFIHFIKLTQMCSFLWLSKIPLYIHTVTPFII